MKVSFGIAVAMSASLIAWLAQNYASASLPLVTVASIAVVAIVVFIGFIHRKFYARLDELEEL